MAWFGWILLAVGTLGVILAQLRSMELALRHPVLKWLLWPYKLMDHPAIGGGINRYLRTVGWLLIALGLLALVVRRA